MSKVRDAAERILMLCVAEARSLEVKPASILGMASRLAKQDGFPKISRAKNPNAVALGMKGGVLGGRARAEKLSPKRRHEIAKLAADARWSRYYGMSVEEYRAWKGKKSGG